MRKKIVFFAFSTFIFGVLFFLVQGQFVVVRLPGLFFPRLEAKSNKTTEMSRVIVYYLWHNKKSVEIKKNILWSLDSCESLKRLISHWLTIGIDEGCLSDSKVLSVALTQQKTVALISFSGSFIPPELDTMSRWQLVESFLKTLRTAGVVLEGIYFLEGKNYLKDDYLDFSQRWPISGYCP